MLEIWKDVIGYEKYYQVSNFGRVKRINNRVWNKGYWRNKPHYITRQEKYLSIKSNKRGYACCVFTKNCIEKGMQVHRLVAQAFIPNPQNKPQVNHKNGIKTDNKVENLEWCTQKENAQHAYINGLEPRGSKNGNALLTEKQILEIRNKHVPRKYPFKQLSKEYNVSVSNIASIVQRKSWKHI